MALLHDFIAALVLAAHLLAMNVACLGPLFAAWLAARGWKRDEPAIAAFGRRVAWRSVAALLLGAVLGGSLGLLAWWERGRSLEGAMFALQTKLWWGAAEIIFSLALMAAFAWALPAARPSAARRWFLYALAALAATNLLYHFPPLFTVLTRFAYGGEIPAAALSASDFRRWMFEPEVLSKTIHFWLASIAVTGVYVVASGEWRVESKELEENAEHSSLTTLHSPLAAIAARWALCATLLQIPVGITVLLALPAGEQSRLMGQDAAGSLLFVASMLAAFVLMQSLSVLSLGNATRGEAAKAAWLMVLVVALMCGTLQRSRAPAEAREEAASKEMQNAFFP